MLASPGTDSSDFHKGKERDYCASVCVCVSLRSDVTQSEFVTEQSSSPCRIPQHVRPDGGSQGPLVHSHMHVRRHNPAPSAQEGALESTRDPEVTSTAISTHLSNQHYIRID